MSTGRFTAPGKTRRCPHCKAVILDSAAVCPACHHHLRFESEPARGQAVQRALRVDGVLRHPPSGEPWEYSVVLSIRDARGEEVSRQVVGVGALQERDERTFSLSVEVFKPAGAVKPVETPKTALATSPPVAAGARAGSSTPRPAEPVPSGVPARPGDGRAPTANPPQPRPRLGGR